MRRGRPIKYPRPPNCPHIDRKEHANGVCYQCSSNINNQRKREKKLEEGGTGEPSPAKRRRKTSISSDGMGMPSHPGLSGYVELNVGGKIFATTFATLTREISLLSLYVSGGAGTENLVAYDKEGRIFIDRDPTHFRWLLNYLRDGYLVTIPSQLQHRLEILHEARYYRLDNLASIIAAPSQYQQPHPYVTQLAAQVLAANAAVQMQQAQAQAQVQAQSRVQVDQEKPSFLTVRPSTRGLFYLCDGKWSSLFPDKNWNTIAVNFEDASDEVSFWSILVNFHPTQDGQLVPSLSSRQELCRCKLDVGMTAKTMIDISHLMDPNSEMQYSPLAEGEFWWEPSQSQYPQLYGRFWRDDVMHLGPLDFLRTEPE
eukprot:TRINITY_DN17067_c0_g1_i1.p1 TRINITY_DN17067_c0_g1~~TRINITY_DN17067_c0_g1_i1.p1  ORF type:complete len:370 (+),score=48.11 TRINITY_DN17067_c0_g1_i1:37-1146(+)